MPCIPSVTDPSDSQTFMLIIANCSMQIEAISFIRLTFFQKFKSYCSSKKDLQRTGHLKKIVQERFYVFLQDIKKPRFLY